MGTIMFEPTMFRQKSRVIFEMLVASGRINILGLSRWTEKGEVIEPSSVFIG
jgi:hypothetical protein